MNQVESFRTQVAPWLLGGLAIQLPFVFGFSLFLNPGDAIFAGLLSAIICGCTFASWMQSKAGATTRYLIATSYVLQAAILLYVFRGHPWQIDIHMIFFAALAMVATLLDWRAIILAAGVTAVHHLALNFIIPAWVFPDNASFLRVVMHAVIVVMETATLIALARSLTAALTASHIATQKADEQAAEALRLKEAADDAERQARDAEHQAQEAADKARLAERQAREAEAQAQEAARQAQEAEQQAREEAAAADDARNQATLETERARNAEVSATSAQESLKAQGASQTQVVNALAGGLRHLAKGELFARLDGTVDEQYRALYNDYNDAVEKLQAVTVRISGSIHSMKTRIDQVDAGSNELSTRTDRQVYSLGETAATLNTITQAITEAANNANRARSVAQETRDEAESSSDIVRQSVDAMKAIEKSSSEISKIIGVIEEIAFQTNLLALNAGVEAARAGDAGRGFAVVASEVRALAQRASGAAQDISQLISGSSREVQNGVKFVNAAGDAIGAIVGRVDEVSTIVAEIASTAEDRASGLASLNNEMGALDKATQQNNQFAQQMRETGQALTSEAEQLAALIAYFRTDEYGTASSRAA